MQIQIRQLPNDYTRMCFILYIYIHTHAHTHTYSLLFLQTFVGGIFMHQQ